MFTPLTQDEYDVMEACQDGLGDRISTMIREARAMVEANKRSLEIMVAMRQARSHALCMELLDGLEQMIKDQPNG